MKKQKSIALLILTLMGNASALTVPTNAAANLVLGQQDFVTSSALSVRSSFTVLSPRGIAVDPVSRKVFVSTGNRVLRFPSATSLTNGSGAEAVFGQARFSSDSAAVTELGMSGPTSLFFDHLGRLWVADSENSRVLMYEAASYRNTQPYPDKVFGQSNFTSAASGTTAEKMSAPYGVWVDLQDRLWVSDFFNNRVLRFDSVSSKAITNASADGVLGQINFTSFTEGTGSSGFSGPEGIGVSLTGTLFVSLPAQNRVLRFDNAATLGNGAGASVVLGQPNFTSIVEGLSATNFSGSYGLTVSRDDTLWVADYNNRRVLRFDKASLKANGAAANGVVGQSNFTTSTAGTSDRLLGGVFLQPFVDTTGALWIPDSTKHRVLRFPADTTRPLLTANPVASPTIKKKVTIKGTASDAYGISKVQYTVNGGSLKTATGTTTWQSTAALKVGKNVITIFATDSVGNKSINKVIKVKRN